MRGSWGGIGASMLGVTFLTGCWKAPRPAFEASAPRVEVLPAQATLTTGRATAFAAKVDGHGTGAVTWRILEPAGGTVDPQGNYQAPAAPGVFTVQAVFSLDGERTAVAKVTVVAAPVGEIKAPLRVLPGAQEQVATIVPVPGSHYHWTINGGSITAGTDTNAITFMAGAGPRVALGCKVTNQAGDTLNPGLDVRVVAAITLAISPAQTIVTAGRAMKFGFTLAGGTSLGVAWSLGQPGAGSLDDSGHYVAPAVPGLYSVRVTALDDPTRFAIAQVKVVPEPPQGMFTPEAVLPGTQGLRAMVPEVAGMTYAWDLEGGTITGGADRPTLIFSAGDGPTVTLRCRITNEAGDSFVTSKTLNAL